MKTVLPNASARIKSHSGNPTFYFYFNQTGTQLSGNGLTGVWLPGAVTSPSEFSLVRFQVANGGREAVLGQFNITGMKSGVMEKARVSFTYDDVAPGVFRVTPATYLPQGEYGFVYSSTGAGGGFGGMPGARIFDFAVVESTPAVASSRSSRTARTAVQQPSSAPPPSTAQQTRGAATAATPTASRTKPRCGIIPTADGSRIVPCPPGSDD